MFEFLFNYRAELFSRGELGLSAGPLRLILLAVGALLASWLILRYRQSLGGARDISPSIVWSLVGLRLVLLVLLVFTLLEPVLALNALKPMESFVAILADNSASLLIKDEEGNASSVAGLEGTRAGRIERALGTSRDGGELRADSLVGRLAQRFQLRSYSFGRQTQRIVSGQPLSFDERSSDLGGALESVRGELSGVPVAGVVLLTDGALARTDVLSNEILRYRTNGVPIYPVTVGKARFERDLELRALHAPRTALLGSTVEIGVDIAYPGMAGETVRVEVRDQGRVVDQREVELPIAGDDLFTVEVGFSALTQGTRSVEVALSPLRAIDEVVAQNNTAIALVDVVAGPHKILYFEGEPRFEYKFLRRAVAGDSQVQVVSLLRMADNRFYRQSVDDELELQDGFPTRREDLFRYRGLILGSVEASFFSYEQLRMIVDFAAERGGGVLFLGGSLALGEGGYAGTPLDELIPVVLSDQREVTSAGRAVAVSPTVLGESHPALQLWRGSGEEPAWAGLPQLFVVNRVGNLKAGAASLLNGHSDEFGTDQVVLAYQRFGAGASMLFSPLDSFRWQMSLPVEDMTHEIFWRQLLRWLISDVDDRIVVSTSVDRVEPGDAIELRALVRDRAFVPESGATVSARVVAPSGAETEIPLRWNLQQDGLFVGGFRGTEPGLHRVEVQIDESSGGDSAAGNQEIAGSSFEVAPLQREFFQATRNTELMETLAKDTGGVVLDPSQVDRLIEELSYSTSGVTVREERPLWNMPILFFSMVFLMAGEWSLRRWQGLR